MDDEISAAQFAELKIDLENLKTSLEDLLTATETGAKPVKLKDNAGRLSRMDEMHNQSILVANRNLTKNRLKYVIAAITRIGEGVYGHCSVCDELIAFNRLKAYPEASMCLPCKSKNE